MLSKNRRSVVISTAGEYWNNNYISIKAHDQRGFVRFDAELTRKERNHRIFNPTPLRKDPHLAIICRLISRTGVE